MSEPPSLSGFLRRELSHPHFVPERVALLQAAINTTNKQRKKLNHSGSNSIIIIKDGAFISIFDADIVQLLLRSIQHLDCHVAQNAPAVI